MTFTFHVARFAIGKSRRHVLSHASGKGAIFRSVPETHRNINIFQAKSPSRRKDFRVGGEAFNRCSPCVALTFETRLKCDRIFQGRRIARLQFQKLKDERAKTNGRTNPCNCARQIKKNPQRLG